MGTTTKKLTTKRRARRPRRLTTAQAWALFNSIIATHGDVLRRLAR